MLLFADGFEHYGTGATGAGNMIKGAWAQIRNYTPLTLRARTSTTSLQSTGADTEARISLKGSKAVAGVGVGLWMENLPSFVGLGFSFRNASNIDLVSICPGTDGSLLVKKGAFNDTTIGISDSVLTANTFHHIEVKATFDDIVGAIEVRVNGIVVVNLTNLDLGTTPATQFALYSKSVAGNNSHAWDDLTLWDDNGDVNNDFIGPVRVLTLFADADTAQADWSIVGSGNGYAAIDEVPPDGDTSYLGTDTVGDKSDFALPELPSELASIAGVFIPAMARSDEAGVSNLKVSMVSGSPDNVDSGGEHILTPSYTYYRDVFETDPATDAAWTKSGFEAALVRIEKSL